MLLHLPAGHCQSDCRLCGEEGSDGRPGVRCLAGEQKPVLYHGIDYLLDEGEPQAGEMHRIRNIEDALALHNFKRRLVLHRHLIDVEPKLFHALIVDRWASVHVCPLSRTGKRGMGRKRERNYKKTGVRVIELTHTPEGLRQLFQ